MDWANTTARGDEKHLSFDIWCDLYKRFYGIYVWKGPYLFSILFVSWWAYRSTMRSSQVVAIDWECLTTPVTDSIKIMTSYWVVGVNDKNNVMGRISMEVIWSLTPTQLGHIFFNINFRPPNVFAWKKNNRSRKLIMSLSLCEYCGCFFNSHNID